MGNKVNPIGMRLQVNRTWEKGVAVEFRIDGQEQEMLLAEIQEAFAAA